MIRIHDSKVFTNSARRDLRMTSGGQTSASPNDMFFSLGAESLLGASRWRWRRRRQHVARVRETDAAAAAVRLNNFASGGVGRLARPVTLQFEEQLQP